MGGFLLVPFKAIQKGHQLNKSSHSGCHQVYLGSCGVVFRETNRQTSRTIEWIDQPKNTLNFVFTTKLAQTLLKVQLLGRMETQPLNHLKT